MTVLDPEVVVVIDTFDNEGAEVSSTYESFVRTTSRFAIEFSDCS